MSAPKHTPGPWTASDPMDGWRVTAADPNRAGKRFAVAEIGPSHRSRADEVQATANARLIAAAPDMAEALQATLTAWAAAKAGDIASAEWMNAAEEQAKAALAKARGPQ